MRVVIDMQGAQINTAAPAEAILKFARGIVRAGKGRHDFLVVLNGSLPASVTPLRRAFSRLLPAENIRTWHSPASLPGEMGDWRYEAAKGIRGTFFASLEPDLVVLSGLNDVQLASVCPRIVLLHENLLAGHDSNQLLSADALIDLSPLGTAAIPADELWEKRVLDGGNFAASLEGMERLAGKREPEQDKLLRSKPKLAYFSPMPPERSGIGDYSTELIPELARHYDIDVIVDQEPVEPSPATERSRVRSVREFLAQSDSYDRVLYHVGNAEFHLYMFDCLEKVPGIVVLHDFFLSGAYAYSEFESRQRYAWMQELYRSHGYGALVERYQEDGIDKAAFRYPSNFSVLQNASGVIVHSKFSRTLADKWYGKDFSDDWECVPHLRIANAEIDREGARRRLGLDEDDFLLCCFGVLGIAKQNQRLLDAWLSSSLAEDRRCKLVFVGENGEDEYAQTLVQTILDHEMQERVTITGWADQSTFRDHLAVADLAVQLRTFSRGETSGTVLDCMNHRVPTIVNACGPMAEVPPDAVWMLPEHFEDEQLVEAIETLRKDPDLGQRIGRRAHDVIVERHDPAACADQYARAIERFHVRNRFSRDSLLDSIATIPSLPAAPVALGELAAAITQTLPPPHPARTIFFDVSATSRTDLKTGIERVTRALMHEFITSPPPGYRLEPVYLSDEGGEWHYRYARRYTLDALDCPNNFLFDERIEPQAGDAFFCSDLAADMVVRADHDGVYERLRQAGVKLSFMVHDLLPLTMPNVFPPNAGAGFESWLKTVARVSETIVCVSRAVASDLREWIARQDVPVNPDLEIGWSHHGADIAASMPTRGISHHAHKVLEKLRERPTFLAVGTIEPRKAYPQVIEAFDRLWREGVDANLVIVGKEGWKDLPAAMRRNIPETARMLNRHPEKNRRLFWLEDISDEYLDSIYASSSCLLAASLGEGFGLPLIEASRHGLPVLARDIPVFREVAREHASYFHAQDPASLAAAIRDWLETSRAGDTAIPHLDWKHSALNLASLLVPSNDAVVGAGAGQHAGELAMGERRDLRRLYVDMSVVSRDDFHTGIQRTARAIHSELASKPPPGFAVYPVRLIRRSGRWAYEYATAYFDLYCNDCCNDLGAIRPRGEIEPRPGDVLLGLDLAGSMVVEAGAEGLYDELREAGVTRWFVVYDLLPVTMPELFPPSDAEYHRQWLQSISRADGVLCISRTVADEYRNWKARTGTPGSAVVRSFSLGGDIEGSMPTSGRPEEGAKQLEALQGRPTFLAVGTVEPRKRHRQLLSAFEELWRDGVDVNLVIVGKQGWNVDELARTLRTHREHDKRLFWLEGISDEYLEAVYAASTCLVAASEDEGFGLPLVEAARHGLPLLVRDIPVFKEVAGASAFYFNGHAPKDIEAAIRAWLDLDARGEAPQSRGLRRRSWRESANELIEAVLGTSRGVELKQTDGS